MNKKEVVKNFLLLWKDGTSIQITGESLSKAMAANGLGISTISNMSKFIEDGDPNDYLFNPLLKKWIELPETK